MHMNINQFVDCTLSVPGYLLYTDVYSLEAGVPDS